MLAVGGTNSGSEWISQKKCFWFLSSFVAISMKNSYLDMLLKPFPIFFSATVRY
jgi:hypothetical protein